MKRKNKLIITLSILIIILGSSIVAFLVFSKQNNDKIVAKVNGEKIYQSQLEDSLNKMLQRQNKEQKIVMSDFPPQVIEDLAKDIYLQKELDKIARHSPVAKNKNIIKQIENYKNATLRQAYLDSIVDGKVNDQTIKDKYSELSSELSGKKEMHLKHILVASEGEAQNIILLLKKKIFSFEQLAKKYSKDEANALNGGDLGYVVIDNLDEDFSKAIALLKKGQTSSPIKTKFGWHIVRVDDIRNVDLPDFESLKPTIADNLKQEIIEKTISKIVKNAKVKILIDLKP